MSEHVIKIEDGRAEFVYSDELADAVADMGGRVVRASHVEPHPTRPGWLADMAPSNGPVLGANGPACRFVQQNGLPWCSTHEATVQLTAATDGDSFEWRCTQSDASWPLGTHIGTHDLHHCEPFARREDALAAERAWLREHRGL